VRILATAPVPRAAHALFERLGAIEVVDVDADGERYAQSLARAEVLLVRGMRVDAEMIEAAEHLRVIARTGAGVDGVDVDAATARGIPVLFAPGAGTVPVAEGAFALILAAAKRLGELGDAVRAGRWSGRYDVEPADLRGALLGIVGFGRIGREVARMGRAFGMRVLAYDPVSPPESGSVVPVDLDELVRRSDVLSLHCALTEQTRGMISRDLLRRVKQGAILVNVARGAIVESEDVLLEALEDGRLSAVGLDVFTSEPPDPAHPLLSDPRVICTPHTVGLTPQWNNSVFGVLADGIERLLAGERPPNLLNPAALAVAVAAGSARRRR